MAKNKAKQGVEAEGESGQQIHPELPGYGIHPAEGGGFLAYRVTNHGATEVLTPTRNGAHKGEQKHSALARMQKALVLEFLGGKR